MNASSTRLIEIAATLGTLIRARRDHQIELSHQQSDYAARVLALAPADGWPGKNEEMRSLARQRAEADDPALKALRDMQSETADELSAIESDIESLSVERRAIEWLIRDRMASALGGRDDDPSADAERDDTGALADHAADLLLAEQIDAYADDDELPF
jgi:hypothetical protein